jgi:hypothetical protein
LDADTLDGIQASSFLRSDADDTATGVITLSGAGSDRLNIYNTTNGGEAGIRFSDATSQTQNGYFRFRHQDSTSPGSAYAANFEFSTDQSNLAVIIDGSGDYFVGTNKVWHAGNDGSGSGLDADTLDGINSGSFLRSDADDTFTGSYIQLGTGSNTYLTENYLQIGNTEITSNDIYINGNISWHAGNDGSGSGLDADTLDGINSGSFLRSDASDTATGILDLNGGVRFVSTNGTGNGISWVDDTRHTRWDGRDIGTQTVVHKFARESYNTGNFQPYYENWYDSTTYRSIGLNSSGALLFTGNTVWHAGNDGSGSGLDADTLDGVSWGNVNTNIVTTGDVIATDILPPTDNTGVVGNSSFTWSNGQFTNLTIDSTLNVRAAIDLADSDQLRCGSSDDFKFYYDGTANEMEFEMEATCNQIRIHDNGTTRFTFERTTGNLLVTGNVGIGTTNPTQKLHVDGTVLSTRIFTAGTPTNDPGRDITIWGSGTRGIYIRNTSSTVGYSLIQDSVGDFKIKRTYSSTSESEGLTLDTSGNLTVVGTVTQNSDISLKKNIQTIPDALETLKVLRGVTYSRKDVNTDNRYIGVIAQEVEEVLPEVVNENEDGIKSVAYGSMVGLLIEAIKEQQIQIEKLKFELNQLKNER